MQRLVEQFRESTTTSTQKNFLVAQMAFQNCVDDHHIYPLLQDLNVPVNDDLFYSIVDNQPTRCADCMDNLVMDLNE
jgi:hypothetical protein